MSCNCNSSVGSPRGNSFSATITIHNNTNETVVLYDFSDAGDGKKILKTKVSDNPVIATIKGGSSFVWNNTLDNVFGKLVWGAEDAGARVVLSSYAGVGVDLLSAVGTPGAPDPAWLSVVAVCNGVSKSGDHNAKLLFDKKSSQYTVDLSFNGYNTPPAPVFITQMNMVNKTSNGVLTVESSNHQHDYTILSGSNMSWEETPEDAPAYTMTLKDGSDTYVGNLLLGQTTGVLVNRGGNGTSVTLLVDAFSTETNQEVTYKQSTGQTSNHQMFRTDQFIRGGRVTLTYSDRSSTDNTQECCNIDHNCK